MLEFRLTYFKFDALAWLHSETVQEMEDFERGQYISLLAHAWLTDKDCSVPGDPKKLLKYCSAREMSEKVLATFPIIEDEKDPQHGRRRNAKQYGDWLAAKGKVDKASMAGRKSGAARKQQPPNESSTDNRTENEQTLNERSTNVELKEKKRKEINTHTPTAPQNGAAGAGVCGSVLLAQLLAALPTAMMSAVLGKVEKAELQQHLDTHGELKIAGTIRAWWAEVEREMDGYRNKWRACLDVLPAWLLKDGDEYAKRESDRRYHESPEGIGAQAARQEKLTRESLDEMGRAYGVDKPPAPNPWDDPNYDPLAGVL